MYKLLPIFSILIIIGACADAGTKPETSSVAGDDTSISNTTANMEGDTATSTPATDVRLALDPDVFTNVFGDVPMVKPTARQLDMLEGVAATLPSVEEQEILSIVYKCRDAGARRILEKI